MTRPDPTSPRLRLLRVTAAVALAAIGMASGAGAQEASDPAAACLQPRQPASQTLEACTRAVDSGAVTGARLAEVRTQRGAALRALNRTDEAIAEFEAAMALDPNNSLPILFRATTFTFLGQHDRAITDYKTAIDKDPKLVNVLFEVGRSLAGARHYGVAVLYFDAALTYKPNDAETLHQRAVARDSAGDAKIALPDIDAAVAAAPDRLNYLVTRAIVRTNVGDDAGAMADFAAVLARQPQDSWSHYRRGHTQFDAGRFNDAAQDFAAHLRLTPGQPFGALWLYVARRRAGEDARAELERFAAGASLSQWPGPIIEMMLGRISPEVLLDSTVNTDERKEKDRSCEALFYIGEYHLIKGDREAATRAFRAVIATGVTDFLEYVRAGVELKRLGP
jgi:lipoprotein NlpI